MKLVSSKDILNFWFGEVYFTDQQQLHSVDYYNARFPLWFGRKSPEFEDIQRLNSNLIESMEILNIEIHNIQDLIAFIVVLDQFPRCIYRGNMNAY